jgi:hypothetical protein
MAWYGRVVCVLGATVDGGVHAGTDMMGTNDEDWFWCDVGLKRVVWIRIFRMDGYNVVCVLRGCSEAAI